MRYIQIAAFLLVVTTLASICSVVYPRLLDQPLPIWFDAIWIIPLVGYIFLMIKGGRKK